MKSCIEQTIKVNDTIINNGYQDGMHYQNDLYAVRCNDPKLAKKNPSPAGGTALLRPVRALYVFSIRYSSSFFAGGSMILSISSKVRAKITTRSASKYIILSSGTLLMKLSESQTPMMFFEFGE